MNARRCDGLIALWMVTLNIVAGGTFGSRGAGEYVPEVPALAKPSSSELREMVERYGTDRERLRRFLSVRASASHDRSLRAFNEGWREGLDRVAVDELGVEERIDYVLLRSHLTHQLRLLDRERRRMAEIAPLLPVDEGIAELQASRRLLERVDAKAAAAKLHALHEQLKEARKALEAGLESEKSDGLAPLRPGKNAALRASARIDELSNVLESWFKHYDGYDPEFSWWTREPYSKLSDGLKDHKKLLREKILGVKAGEDEPIVGDPIGRAGLLEELEHEFIAYTPEELIEIANREFAWCDSEWRRTARELGLGDDWKAALERSKNDYVAPGRQPELIRDLAREMIEYVQRNDLVTVPPLAAETWRMRMMSPAEQKVNPFFLGGESISVSFPTAEMPHEEKLGSFRANNIHVARATVFHELIPGHSLQDFMMDRYQPHRSLFSTPFWIEGWALWWEFLLYDRGYTSKDPLDRAGALFWRSHRCARIIFSLNFHLGNWSPQECIDFLVERVGHDRHTATGEVRRSFNGNYSPLYQVGYMMGALQFRALNKELVAAGRMTAREFHDRIMQGGTIPIEMVRARLRGEKLLGNYRASWRFAE